MIGWIGRRPSALLSALVATGCMILFVSALDFRSTSRTFPLIATGIGFALAMVQLVIDIVAPEDRPRDTGVDLRSDDDLPLPTAIRLASRQFAWIVGLAVATWLIGFVVAVPLFVFLFVLWTSPRRALLGAAVAIGLEFVLLLVFVTVLNSAWPTPVFDVWEDWVLTIAEGLR